MNKILSTVEIFTFFKRKSQKIFLVFFGLILFPSVYSQSTGDLELRVDSIINSLVNTNNYSGTVLISQNDEILLSKAYGKMSREYDLNNTSETKFFLASISMIFTSVAIMQLQEQGKLLLSDPVSKFIPGYKHGKEITIDNLLTQRSGIPAIGADGKIDYDSITKFEHDAKKLYSYFEDYELLSEPGAKYYHGRSDYIILAYIIEQISGKTFGKYLEDEIFFPLGMNNTGHYFSEKNIIKNLAKGYGPKGLFDVESAQNIDWSSKTGHGSIYSTTGDLQNFALAALKNNFLTKASWNKIFTDYGDKVGYGWFISKHLNRERFQMNGMSPGFSSYLAIYPEEHLIVIVLSNIYVSLPSFLGTSIAALTLGEEFESLNLTKEAVSSEFAKKLVGIYRFEENFYSPNYELTIKYENGNLISDWGGLIPIDNGSKNFTEYILRTYWSNISFIIEDDKVKYMMFDKFKGIKLE